VYTPTPPIHSEISTHTHTHTHTHTDTELFLETQNKHLHGHIHKATASNTFGVFLKSILLSQVTPLIHRPAGFSLPWALFTMTPVLSLITSDWLWTQAH